MQVFWEYVSSILARSWLLIRNLTLTRTTWCSRMDVHPPLFHAHQIQPLIQLPSIRPNAIPKAQLAQVLKLFLNLSAEALYRPSPPGVAPTCQCTQPAHCAQRSGGYRGVLVISLWWWWVVSEWKLARQKAPGTVFSSHPADAWYDSAELSSRKIWGYLFICTNLLRRPAYLNKYALQTASKNKPAPTWWFYNHATKWKCKKWLSLVAIFVIL
jgi:hypothetical protein